MPFTVTLPKLSPTMEGGTLVAWHKKVGDKIAADDLLIEVATDKATVEYQALDPGYLREILIQAGQEAKVNQPIAICTATPDESLAGYTPHWSGDGEPSPQITAPPTLPSPQVTASPTSPSPPKESKGPAAPAPRIVKAMPAPVEANRPFFSSGQRVQASPYAKKVANEHRLDLGSVSGTGPGGRVMSRDLEHAQPLSAVAFGRQDKPSLPAGSAAIEELTPMRKIIGQRLLESKTTIPHFYVSMTVNAQALMELREQLSAWGLKVTVNDLVVRATALALRQHPDVNSGFDPAAPGLVRYQTIDISIAVAIPGGLITPIISHADTKNLGEISAAVKDLAGRAKEGKLQPHEYQGGSFTISNLGMFGADNFFPIINPPQAAILGVGGIRDVAVVQDGKVVPGREMQLSLAADHRVIDGAEAARFLRTLKGFLEAPTGLVVG